MFRIITLISFFVLTFTAKSQDLIRITDPIPNHQAILVIPGITSLQLQAIKTEFIKYDEIKRAVYVYGDHNCLLIELNPGGVIKFYSDLMKIIQAATGLTEKDVAIKTSSAYNKIMPSTDVPSTNFNVK